MATKCTICGSLSCCRQEAREAKTVAETKWLAAVRGRTNRDGLYHALKAADARYDNARALCFTTHDENDRQMRIGMSAANTIDSLSVLLQNDAKLSRMPIRIAPTAAIG